MKILIFSPAFPPMIGGIENIAYMLAKEWGKAGAEVTVVTQAEQVNFADDKEQFKILRNPTRNTYWSAYKKADLTFFLNVSLKGLLPIIISRLNPIFISHHITYYNIDGSINFLEQIKRQLSRFFINTSVSEYVRQTLPNKQGYVINNAYNSDVFKIITDYDARMKDIIFVGRLVSDKGLDTLIKALALINSEQKQSLNLTVIGTGPELDYLKHLSLTLNIHPQVTFIGNITGMELAKKINEHKLMVVPSKWKEPFGIVALEGLACGCRMVVAKDGGLREAVGNMAQVFENGCEKSLASAILTALLTSPIPQKEIDTHLENHRPTKIAQQYIALFEKYIK